MTRVQKCKNLLYGVGALGGTVAIFATVLEKFYGEVGYKHSLKSPQLKAESISPSSVSSNSSRGSKFERWDYNWDNREAKGGATRHLILVRHGQYNLAGLTDQERQLTSLGRSQAEMTGVRLAELSLPYTAIIHSNMTRAVETAGLISRHLPQE